MKSTEKQTFVKNAYREVVVWTRSNLTNLVNTTQNQFVVVLVSHWVTLLEGAINANLKIKLKQVVQH